jgi:hypothetical protein
MAGTSNWLTELLALEQYLTIFNQSLHHPEMAGEDACVPLHRMIEDSLSAALFTRMLSCGTFAITSATSDIGEKRRPILCSFFPTTSREFPFDQKPGLSHSTSGGVDIRENDKQIA